MIKYSEIDMTLVKINICLVGTNFIFRELRIVPQIIYQT
jgi:hypothetical protein